MRGLALALVVMAPSVALADVIMPVPLECPPGAAVSVRHTGAVCVPTSCASAADCDAARPCGSRARFECRPQALCVEPRTVRSHRGRASLEIVVATADCHASRSCASGECVEAMRCVSAGELDPSELPPPQVYIPPPSSGCGASASAALVVLVLLVASGAVVARRARARAIEQDVHARLERGAVSRDAVAADHGASGARALDRLAARDPARVRIDATEEGDLLYTREPPARCDRAMDTADEARVSGKNASITTPRS